MATSYGERRDALTQMQVTLKTARGQLDQAATIILAGKTQCDDLPTKLKTFLDDIQADKGQGGAAYAVMANEAEIMLAEAQSLSATCNAKVKAMQAAG